MRDNLTLKHLIGKKGEVGLSKWTVLVFGLLTAAIVFVAYHVLPFYYYYYELQNQMSSLARVASTHTDREIRKKLDYHIRKMELPFDVADVSISRQEDRIQMSIQYKEIFYVTFRDKDYDLHTFHFHAYVDEAY